MKQVHIFPRPLNERQTSPETMNRRNKFSSQKAVSQEDQRIDNSGGRKIGDLRIHIEKDSLSPNTPMQFTSPNDTQMVQSSSCDK